LRLLLDTAERRGCGSRQSRLGSCRGGCGDLFPVRPKIHNYSREIHAIWKKTPAGFSGDVVVPVSFFDRRNFSSGQQIGLSFGAQKAFPPKDPSADNPDRIIFSSKGDSLFPVDQENPETLQLMVLRGVSDATRASF
jgi:hypothetical protein